MINSLRWAVDQSLPHAVLLSVIVVMNLSALKHPVAAFAFFICSALAGYAAFFGDFTYEEYDTYIEIADYPEDATGNVIIPNEIAGKPVISIGDWAFYECSSLTSVTIPDSVTSIGKGAFQWCSSLTSATIPDSVTSIGDQAFFYCNSLTIVTIPDSVTSIGEFAFASCTSLTSVTIGNSVTSIGDAAFYYCSSLTSVTIPDSVTSLGRYAFRDCTSLTSIYFKGNAPNLNYGTFENANNVTVYYLAGRIGWGETYGGRPTVEISVLPDPLIGGSPVDAPESWFLSEWLGIYYTYTDSHWLFHAEHGFLYRAPSSTNASMYFYDDAMGAWWWTSETYYPYIYAFDPPADLGGTDVGSEWLFYFEGSNDPRQFGVVTGVTNPILSFDP